MFGYPERFIDVPGAESEDAPVDLHARSRRSGHGNQPRHRLVGGETTQ